jgi:peptidoglycan-associated lipoprotein
MNRKLSLTVMLIMGLTLAACSSKPTQETASEPTPAPTQPQQQPVADNNAYGTGYSIEDLASLGIEGDPLNYRTVYFEFDSSEIDQRSRVVLDAHARSLSGQSGVQVVLEGHADERGTREYNLALGERRGQTAERLMQAVGIGGNSVQVVSYGEERPVALEHNESAWALNRRVEILY